MKHLATAALAAMLVSAPALASDRDPTPEERTAIEKTLQAMGYTSWDDIELDNDGYMRKPAWEIDDARKGNGPKFDVKLEPGTLKVLKEERDD